MTGSSQEKEKINISETTVVSGVPPSPPPSELATNMVLRDDSEETEEEALVIRNPRSNLAKDSAPRSSRSPIMEFHRIEEVALELRIQRESLLDAELLRLNTELMAKGAEVIARVANLTRQQEFNHNTVRSRCQL
ncbi:hypothetical protein HAX54_005910 [Datura stramonium]|uniref:Uncharacterized protein n=1 Tax=Datura stramonium TaxID=4076 RepID=A0ABS8WTR0_DATST|nr:hypothetical protein [Datura stramonium]